MARTPLVVTLSLVLLLLTGCSFDRKWRNMSRAQLAAADAANESSDPLAGRWDGKWVSERSGHSGRLRAIITPVDATTYRVTYDATYMGLLRFGYGMELKTASAETRPANAATAFTGEENLGALAGGVYRYNGTADGITFRSTYESSADNGYFEMKRPAVKKR